MNPFERKSVEPSPAEDLLAFIHESPTMFHTAASIRARLDEAGFTYLPEGDAWDVRPGGAYYSQRNGSSVVAWRVGEGVSARCDGAVVDGLQGAASGEGAEADAAGPHGAVPEGGAPYHFQLTASHSDSPCFKVKSDAEVEGPADYLRLDTEAYGGMMDYTWFDRPLSLAGRVLVRDGARIESRLVALNRGVALIPSLAIHMNGEVNKGFAPNRASDLFPLVSAGDLGRGSLDTLIADALEIDPGQIVARDLFLVNADKGRVWGATDEFISSPRLDDLMCAYTSLQAFIARGNANAVTVYACFDNEEVGSGTKQGAASTLLADALSRIKRLPRVCARGPVPSAFGLDARELRQRSRAASGPSGAGRHARPSADERGLVVKEAANQHYCTDAFSRAVLTAILDDAEIPHQCFSNRSDKGRRLDPRQHLQHAGELHAVDVGCAQLAMHSCVETAGARDVELAIEALAAFLRSGYPHRRGGGRRAGVARHRDAAAPSETPSPPRDAVAPFCDAAAIAMWLPALPRG